MLFREKGISIFYLKDNTTNLLDLENVLQQNSKIKNLLRWKVRTAPAKIEGMTHQ